ncbi:cyclic nucleotide-binding domain-containing protein [Geminocystis sp. GBBB08]|uniref:cyclic nucleotide-binding domain-containing protein n=1 Tax=Geminocystis sp. GBBB08 TaxID=2604140 RepID=UPI0027E3529A|nr:cyclic nucleotide-binding domain-containing protein [Geminocystis sp. GBBB08]MBL1209345.1 cyclic nucleotide-binding domain-containing protein [Geminocystis sp. GBBB08]
MLEPSDVIDLFFNHLKTRNFSEGEVIFREGEKGDKMFALMKGEVELWLNNQVVETIHQHDVFGEGALVQLEHTRMTTAIAKTDCELAELNKERFLFLLQETPLFALEIVRSLSSRLRKVKLK